MTKPTPIFIAQAFGDEKTQEDFALERAHLVVVTGNQYGAVTTVPFEAIDEGKASAEQKMLSLGKNIEFMSCAEIAVFSSDWQKSEMCRYLHGIAVGYGMEIIESYSDWRNDD